jgi:hypothetical protein
MEFQLRDNGLPTLPRDAALHPMTVERRHRVKRRQRAAANDTLTCWFCWFWKCVHIGELRKQKMHVNCGYFCCRENVDFMWINVSVWQFNLRDLAISDPGNPDVSLLIRKLLQIWLSNVVKILFKNVLMFFKQRWVALSALPSLGCVTVVKRYKLVHKNLSENKQISIFVFFPSKFMRTHTYKNDIPDCLDHLTPIRLHRRVQKCRLYMHEFFGLSKRLFNHLTGPFILKIAKIHRFQRPPWTYLDRISENGFQRIEIRRELYWKHGCAEKCWHTDIHTDWRTLRTGSRNKRTFLDKMVVTFDSQFLKSFQTSILTSGFPSIWGYWILWQ